LKEIKDIIVKGRKGCNLIYARIPPDSKITIGKKELYVYHKDIMGKYYRHYRIKTRDIKEILILSTLYKGGIDGRIL